jgi:hypothetical protein
LKKSLSLSAVDNHISTIPSARKICPVSEPVIFGKYHLQAISLGYMTKTLNQFLFSSTKIRIFFQQHWESEYFFRKKK